MRIAIPDGKGGFHLLTNEDLKVGDEVFPIVSGYTKGDNFYAMSINYSPECSGWPDEPHTMMDLEHSDTKGYQVRTQRGYGPIETYFRVIKE